MSGCSEEGSMQARRVPCSTGVPGGISLYDPLGDQNQFSVCVCGSGGVRMCGGARAGIALRHRWPLALSGLQTRPLVLERAASLGDGLAAVVPCPSPSPALARAMSRGRCRSWVCGACAWSAVGPLSLRSSARHHSTAPRTGGPMCQSPEGSQRYRMLVAEEIFFKNADDQP